MQLNITDYWTTYARVLDKARGTRPLRSSEAMPSSGLLGEPLLLVAHLPYAHDACHEVVN